jgi:FkbM family methyltransferase
MAPLFFDCALQSRVIFDVGAHVGFYTLLAAHARSSARIFAFEPQPDAFQRLTRNVALNRTENVRCVPSACGAKDGSEILHEVVVAGIPSGSTLRGELMKPEWGLRCRSVNVIALDRFVRHEGLGQIDMMKLDTEGTESTVLEGMRETLRRDRPALFCEVLPGRNTGGPLEGLLGPLGYRYHLLTGDGPMVMQRIEPHPRWLNWLFVGPEHGLWRSVGSLPSLPEEAEVG